MSEAEQVLQVPSHIPGSRPRPMGGYGGQERQEKASQGLPPELQETEGKDRNQKPS
jgi:hypothetical protein